MTCPHSTKPGARIESCSLCTSAAYGFVPTRVPMGESGRPLNDSRAIDAYGRRHGAPQKEKQS